MQYSHALVTIHSKKHFLYNQSRIEQTLSRILTFFSLFLPVSFFLLLKIVERTDKNLFQLVGAVFRLRRILANLLRFYVKKKFKKII